MDSRLIELYSRFNFLVKSFYWCSIIKMLVKRYFISNEKSYLEFLFKKFTVLKRSERSFNFKHF